MFKLVVCIFCIIPLLVKANSDFPLEFSLSSGYMSSQDNDLLVQQQEIKFNYNDLLAFDFSPANSSESNAENDSPIQTRSPQYDSLRFNHYQQVFSAAMLESQINAEVKKEVQLHYLHFGSNYAISAKDNLWLSAGLGLTYFSAPNRAFDDDIKLSMSLGVHKDFVLDNRFKVRLESRVYSIFLAGENNSLCQQLACGSSDSLWLQNEVSLSISYQF